MALERQKLSAKIPNLMLGTGKLTRYEDSGKIELHLSSKDYTSLLTQRIHPHDVFSVIDTDKRTQKKDHVGRKGTAVVLPKTYITRSGSLFLYSDSKIMRDNQDTIQGGMAKSQNLSIQGKSVPKRTKGGDSYPNWGRLLTPRSCQSPQSPWTASGSRKKRERVNHHREDNRPASRVPYIWNYAVTPLKLINMPGTEHLKTVQSLSEAILTYNQARMTGSDRYANVMAIAGDASKSFKGEHLELTIGGYRGDPDMLALERARTNLSRQSIIYDRVPVNTPMSSELAGTQDRVKLRRRIKSSFTSQREPRTTSRNTSYS